MFVLPFVEGGTDVSGEKNLQFAMLFFQITCTTCASPDAQKIVRQHLSYIIMINQL